MRNSKQISGPYNKSPVSTCSPHLIFRIANSPRGCCGWRILTDICGWRILTGIVLRGVKKVIIQPYFNGWKLELSETNGFNLRMINWRSVGTTTVIYSGFGIFGSLRTDILSHEQRNEVEVYTCLVGVKPKSPFTRSANLLGIWNDLGQTISCYCPIGQTPYAYTQRQPSQSFEGSEITLPVITI